MMKCSQKHCSNEARWRFVWTDFQYCCDECKEGVLAIADAMGFPTPASTMERFPYNPFDDPLSDENRDPL